jgi:hypothetical protein
MTCVSCSSAIENGLREVYKDKGLVKLDDTANIKNVSRDENNSNKYAVNVVLLLHKMQI